MHVGVDKTGTDKGIAIIGNWQVWVGFQKGLSPRNLKNLTVADEQSTSGIDVTNLSPIGQEWIAGKAQGLAQNDVHIHTVFLSFYGLRVNLSKCAKPVAPSRQNTMVRTAAGRFK
jgi:hypothetical protein